VIKVEPDEILMLEGGLETDDPNLPIIWCAMPLDGQIRLVAMGPVEPAGPRVELMEFLFEVPS
jgi:hypothetical protein